MESLSKVWYTDEDLLHNNLIHHTLTDISKHQLVNRNNTSLKRLTQLMRDIINNNIYIAWDTIQYLRLHTYIYIVVD